MLLGSATSLLQRVFIDQQLNHRFGNLYRSCSVSARCIKFSSSVSFRSHPEWLRSLLQDKSAGPRIYRWSLDSVSSKGVVGMISGDEKNVCETGHNVRSSLNRDVIDEHRRIYILGVGNLGRLIATSLAKLPNRPPITLVVHRESLLNHWRIKPGLVIHPQQRRFGYKEQRMVDFDIEMWSEEAPPLHPPQAKRYAAGDVKNNYRDDGTRTASEMAGTIRNIIITTKAQDAMPQVDRLRKYLSSESTVLFAQNGMNKLWPPYGAVYNAARYGQWPPVEGKQGASESLRQGSQLPRWLACVVTHGVTSAGLFESTHNSPAGMVIGPVSTRSGSWPEHTDSSTSYLLQQLLSSHILNAHCVPSLELWLLQLEKLVVNSVVNPLTAILRCRNGDLLKLVSGEGGGYNDDCTVSRIVNKLLKESSIVLWELLQSEQGSRIVSGMSALPSTSRGDINRGALFNRLAFSSLQSMLYRVLEIVKNNTSSMLQDVISGKTTEVREFNGWWVDMATYLKGLSATAKTLDVSAHQTLIRLVEEGRPLKRKELGVVYERNSKV